MNPSLSKRRLVCKLKLMKATAPQAGESGNEPCFLQLCPQGSSPLLRSSSPRVVKHFTGYGAFSVDHLDSFSRRLCEWDKMSAPPRLAKGSLGASRLNAVWCLRADPEREKGDSRGRQLKPIALCDQDRLLPSPSIACCCGRLTPGAQSRLSTPRLQLFSSFQLSKIKGSFFKS